MRSSLRAPVVLGGGWWGLSPRRVQKVCVLVAASKVWRALSGRSNGLWIEKVNIFSVHPAVRALQGPLPASGAGAVVGASAAVSTAVAASAGFSEAASGPVPPVGSGRASTGAPPAPPSPAPARPPLACT